MANLLEQKTDKTVDAIELLATATLSDCKTYANLATTVASLAS